METIKKHKWIIHTFTFCSLVLLFIFSAVFLEEKSWVGNLLQTIGTVAGIYLTVIIFYYSKEGSDLQFREHLKYLQEFNTRQIQALQHSTERQIAVLQETNAKEIAALQELTERQIDALHKTNYEQISSFEHQIREVTAKLSESSVLLAEILGRELEKSIDFFTHAVTTEEARYKDLNGWKLGRTEQEACSIDKPVGENSEY